MRLPVRICSKWPSKSYLLPNVSKVVMSWEQVDTSLSSHYYSFAKSGLEHSDSGKIIGYDSFHADESIFRFDSIRQFDKTDLDT